MMQTSPNSRRLSRRRFLTGSAAAAGVAAVGCAGAPQEESAATSVEDVVPASEEGFVSIFNGKDLGGWEGDTKLWLVEDGVLVGRSPGIDYNDFLGTEKTYGNFILRFKIHLLNNDGNTGVQFRSKRMEGSTEMIGYQADAGPTWWGNLYDESRRRITLVEADPALIDRILEPNDWNDYEVYANEDHIRLLINGETTVDYREEDASIARDGVIATQIHSGPPLEVRFKDIRIKEL